MIRRSGRAGKERRGEPASLLVVGLGNPGARFEGTRHNVGAEAVALLAERHSGSLRKSRELARVAEVRIRGERVALAVPQTFYERIRPGRGQAGPRHGIDEPTKIVIVHDELDLPGGGAEGEVRRWPGGPQRTPLGYCTPQDPGLPAGSHRCWQTPGQAVGCRSRSAQARCRRSHRVGGRGPGGRRCGRGDSGRGGRRGHVTLQLSFVTP